MSILDDMLAASEALTRNDLEFAAHLIEKVELNLKAVTDPKAATMLRANLGGIMIDLGSWTRDEKLLERGTQYAVAPLSEFSEGELTVEHYYNAANGYSALWQIRSTDALKQGKLDVSLQEQKKLYRKAIDLANSHPLFILENRDFYNQLLVNYGNCFDSISRSIEAVSQYDQVLKRTPSMGDALGNKGITLSWLTPLAHGHGHLFYLESHRLLGEAIKQPLHTQALRTFQKHFERVEHIIHHHGEMKPEEIKNNQPLSEFHKFLQDFCVLHELFLTPTTLVGSKGAVVTGDPLFINSMVASLDDAKKFDRYVTFLNQIKQDYIFARYLLVQSQYRSSVVDAIDEGAALYYPLDYSLHSSYIQMLKTAFRLAVDVLDKIAFFVRDYYGVHSLPEKDVKFRSIFPTKNDPLILRPEFANIGNPFIFALFDLSLDLRVGGDYEFVHKIRNALTHRVFVIHEIMIREDEENDNIPRAYLDKFLKDCIQTMQIARAAVMYLIMVVDFEEKRVNPKWPYGVIPGTPVDGVFRWVPMNGEDTETEL